MTELTWKALGSDTGGSTYFSLPKNIQLPAEVILLPDQNIVRICRQVNLIIIYEAVSSFVTLLLAPMQN